VITITIAAPQRQTLYMDATGAEDDNGQPIRVGPQNTAATVYAIPLLATGLKDHAK
jgi:hypothetical protein